MMLMVCILALRCLSWIEIRADYVDCHAFWKEFTTEESIFDNISPGTSELGGNDPRQNMAELSAGSSRSDLA
jgi:hypothetical protein